MAEDCGCSGGRCGSLASMELNRRDFHGEAGGRHGGAGGRRAVGRPVEAKEPAALTAPISAGPRPIR